MQINFNLVGTIIFLYIDPDPLHVHVREGGLFTFSPQQTAPVVFQARAAHCMHPMMSCAMGLYQIKEKETIFIRFDMRTLPQ